MIIFTNVAFDHFDSGQWSGAVAWGVFFAGTLGLPFVMFAIILMLASPLEARHQYEVEARIAHLALKRQERIEEREQFYSSSEWLTLRSQVIEEEGRVCAHCGRSITDDAEVAVDHIKPRSRHPELSLVRENLQVLCRRCNSSKGSTG